MSSATHLWEQKVHPDVPEQFLQCAACGFQSTIRRAFNVNSDQMPIRNCPGLATWETHWESQLMPVYRAQDLV